MAKIYQKESEIHVSKPNVFRESFIKEIAKIWQKLLTNYDLKF